MAQFAIANCNETRQKPRNCRLNGLQGALLGRQGRPWGLVLAADGEVVVDASDLMKLGKILCGKNLFREKQTYL